MALGGCAFVGVGVGLVLWSAGGVATAQGPATVGHNTTPSTEPSPTTPPPSNPAAGNPPPRRSVAPNQGQPSSGGGGQPFIPPGAGAGTVPTTTPSAPPTAVAPVTPSPGSTSSSGSSGGPNWVEVATGAGIAVAGGGLVGRSLMGKGTDVVESLGLLQPDAPPGVQPASPPVHLASPPKSPDELKAEYDWTCDTLGSWKKAWEGADEDAAAAQAQAAQVADAWRRARDYLSNQLRDDYISAMRNRGYGYTAASVGGGPLTWVAVPIGIALSKALWGDKAEGFFDYGRWNAQVNQEQASAYALLDGLYKAKRELLQSKLDVARNIQAQAPDELHRLTVQLVTLRASNPKVSFKTCPWES